MSASITIITPTIGRESLRKMLDVLVPQLLPSDEVIVIGDGPQPVAENIVRSFDRSEICYLEHGPIRNYGNPQRNLAISMARGKYIHFVDDDDVPALHALESIRRAAAEAESNGPPMPLMFRIHHGLAGEIWKTPSFAIGNVSGQMFVTPNVPGRLGRWSGAYAADFDFIATTVACYPEGESAIRWREENICTQGYAGTHPDAVIL